MILWRAETVSHDHFCHLVMASFLQERWVGDWINSRITNGEAELCFDAFALKNIIVKVTRGQLSRCLGVFVFRLNHGILVGMDSINGKQK